MGVFDFGRCSSSPGWPACHRHQTEDVEAPPMARNVREGSDENCFVPLFCYVCMPWSAGTSPPRRQFFFRVTSRCRSVVGV
eukprot:3712021-Pyramimonas_sp.AAC.1